jgi:hypothetical protein
MLHALFQLWSNCRTVGNHAEHARASLRCHPFGDLAIKSPSLEPWGRDPNWSFAL